VYIPTASISCNASGNLFSNKNLSIVSLTIPPKPTIIIGSEYLTIVEAEAASGVQGSTVPSWWPKLVGSGVSNSNGSAASGYTPIFQFLTSIVMWMAYMNGTDTRASIPTNLDDIADFVRSQSPPSSVLAFNGYNFYGTNYTITDPSALGTPENGTFTTALAWLSAWTYARSGHTDTAARDFYDQICHDDHLIYIESTSQMEAKGRKIFGEVFYLAFHGAALRAGCPWNAWEVPA
jgi:hypothetical protein